LALAKSIRLEAHRRWNSVHGLGQKQTSKQLTWQASVTILLSAIYEEFKHQGSA
jgi:hypothetical protein